MQDPNQITGRYNVEKTAAEIALRENRPFAEVAHEQYRLNIWNCTAPPDGAIALPSDKFYRSKLDEQLFRYTRIRSPDGKIPLLTPEEFIICDPEIMKLFEEEDAREKLKLQSAAKAAVAASQENSPNNPDPQEAGKVQEAPEAQPGQKPARPRKRVRFADECPAAADGL